MVSYDHEEQSLKKLIFGNFSSTFFFYTGPYTGTPHGGPIHHDLIREDPVGTLRPCESSLRSNTIKIQKIIHLTLVVTPCKPLKHISCLSTSVYGISSVQLESFSEPCSRLQSVGIQTPWNICGFRQKRSLTFSPRQRSNGCVS